MSAAKKSWTRANLQRIINEYEALNAEARKAAGHAYLHGAHTFSGAAAITGAGAASVNRPQRMRELAAEARLAREYLNAFEAALKAARNEAVERGVQRRLRTARAAGKKWHGRTFRPPNRGTRNIGGAGYRRRAASTSVGSPRLANLHAMLIALENARGDEKRKIYNEMLKIAGQASNRGAAANIMLHAIGLMKKARLL